MKLRKIEKLVDGEFISVDSFFDLHKGDKFRVFESDGTPVQGDYLYIANGEASLDANGVEGISVIFDNKERWDKLAEEGFGDD